MSSIICILEIIQLGATMTYKALIAEDDVCLNELIAMTLGDSFQVESAFSVHQAEQLNESHSFDVVILDYTFPDGNGVELAKQFSQQQDPPVILFLSGSDELDVKMAAFDCGACDWIDKKEFAPALFNLKVMRALKNRHEFKSLKQAESESNQLVFSAMSDSFVWGSAARAIQDCLSCESFDELLVSLFGFMQSLELNVAVAINENTRLSYWDNPALEASGIEQDLFKLVMQNDKRIVVAGRRSFFQDSDICILVKNMPLDEVKLGQFNDVLAAYIECANHQVNVLNQNYVKRLYFKKVSNELANLKKKMSNFNSETQEIQTKQSLAFFEIFSQLELTNDEEEKLTHVTDETLLKFEHLANSHHQLITSLNEVMEDFQRQLK